MREPLTEAWRPEASGTRVDQYALIRLIGQGGMGEVYLARDLTLGRLVAIKLMSRLSAADPKREEMFLNEARLTAQLSHPNIVALYGFGRFHDRPYVALEYVRGETLKARIGHERLDVREILRIAAGVARGVAAAHAKNVLHRDLKPSNVIMADDGRPRVVDFGIARALAPGTRSTRAPAQRQERTGVDAFGSPPYMAPEQWAGVDSKGTDVWALGVLLHELVTGRTPYESFEFPALIARVTSADPVELGAEFKDVPTSLSALVRGCLRKDPAERPSATDVVEMLESVEIRPTVQETGDNPFRGLAPFTEDQADSFFGRDDEAEALIERIRTDPMVVVAGPSGVGKSSFVRAGVLPRLHGRGSWHVVRVRPGARPMRVLASRLVTESSTTSLHRASPPRAATDDTQRMLPPAAFSSDTDRVDLGFGSATEAELAASLLRSPESLSVQLHAIASRLGCRVLLFVDQFEEVLTLVEDDAERRAFLDAVCTAAIDPREPVRVVLTVRDDFLGRIPWGAHARVALASVSMLAPPGDAALQDTIVRPLRARGYAFEDPVIVQEMISAVRGEAACLPLLQFALFELWHHRDTDHRNLTRAAYTASGGVTAALANHADRVLDAMSSAELALARALLFRLVTPAGTRRPAERDQLLDGLPDHAADVLGRLIDARLVSVRRHGGDVESIRVELAHESLASSWKRLARWIQESREELTALEEIHRAASLWHERGRRPDELWNGDVLHQARRHLERATSPVPKVAHDFVTSGVARLQQSQRFRRRLTVAVMTALGLAAITSGTAAWAIWKNAAHAERAQAQAELDSARILQESAYAAQARRDPFEARARTRSAFELHDSRATRMLWAELSRDPLLWRFESRVVLYDVAYSPDSRLLVAAGQDGLLRVFDTKTYEQRVLSGHEDQVLTARFAPDSSLVTGDWSGHVRRWNLSASTSELLVRSDHSVLSVAFSHDGRWMATASHLGTVELREAATGKLHSTLEARTGRHARVAFAPADDRLAFAASTGVRLIRAGTGTEVVRIPSEEHVDSLAFSPDGTTLAVSTWAGAIRLHDASTGALRQSLRGHAGRVRALLFANDGSRLVSGGYDGTLRHFDVVTGEQLASVPLPHDIATGLALTHDGSTLASSGRTGLALWSMRPGRPNDGPQKHKPAIVNDVVFTPDGNHIVAAKGGGIAVSNVASGRRTLDTGHAVAELDLRAVSIDNTGTRVATSESDGFVRLRELPSGRLLREVYTGSTAAGGVALDANAELIAAGTHGGEVQVFEASTGQRVANLTGQSGTVSALAFDTTAERLVTGGADGSVWLWRRDPTTFERIWQCGSPIRDLAFDPSGVLLALATEAGEVWLLDVGTWHPRRVHQHDGRLYGIAFHPGGQHLVLASSNGSAFVLRLDGQVQRTLGGHRSEVNAVAVSPDGKLVVTGSDDASVRLWRFSDGRPVWRGLAAVGAPPSAFNHHGWKSLDGSGSAPSEPWKSLVHNTRLLAREGASACVVTFDESVERWSPGGKSPAVREQAPNARSVVATKSGCVTLQGHDVVLVDSDGPRTVERHASALGPAPDGFVVASATHVSTFDATGARQAQEPSPPIASAVAVVGTTLVVGASDGVLMRKPAGASGFLPFQQAPAGRIALVREGPSNTVVAGTDTGWVGVWDVDTGDRLLSSVIDGPPIDAVAVGDRVHVLGELGDQHELDLSLLSRPYCEVLRDVWASVPFAWRSTGPALVPPPATHRCNSP